MTDHRPFTRQERTEAAYDRQLAREVPYRWWVAEPPVFEGLEALLRDQEAAELLLHGLTRHYANALSNGRLHLWAKAAHAIVDLLADPFADAHRRTPPPPTPPASPGPDA